MASSTATSASAVAASIRNGLPASPAARASSIVSADLDASIEAAETGSRTAPIAVDDQSGGPRSLRRIVIAALGLLFLMAFVLFFGGTTRPRVSRGSSGSHPRRAACLLLRGPLPVLRKLARAENGADVPRTCRDPASLDAG